MINRAIKDAIVRDMFQGKVILLIGARQVGKTTLLRQIAQEHKLSYKWLSGDEPDIRARLSQITSTELKQFYGENKLIIIDEAQRIENIGLTLKLSIDNFPDIQVIATGSSAFELTNQINEPLTGRKYEYQLYPISFQEMSNHIGDLEEKRLLETRLVYGSYPEVINQAGNEERALIAITDSYLYKDLFAYEGIKKTSILHNLLKSLALQVGSEVSFNELSNSLGINKITVEKYIDLLEQAYVIFRLNAISRNVRNELKKSKKIYFYDNGVRNAILGNYLTVNQRNDIGALWENYLISERIKSLSYNQMYRKRYFWRTTQQQEIDYLEEYNGEIDVYEFKWGHKRHHLFSKTFTENYPIRQTKLIHRENYEEFLTEW